MSIHASRPELLVVPAEEMIGKTVHDILPPDATDVVMLALREANETGRSYGRQIKLQVPQGTLWFEFSIARKSVLAGEQPCFVVLSHDITERKKTTEWLRKSLEEIEDLYNHAACGYHSLDKDGTIRRINDTELAWLGYTRDEVIGKMKWPDLLTSASQKIFKKDYPRLMKQGHINNIEVEIIRRDGTIFNGLINASAIYDTSGDYVMNRATVFDITERTRLERETIELRDEMAELQKLHVAAQTAAAFAHELNQPLLAIASYSKAALMLLQAGKPDLDKARLAIEGSERQAHRAGQAIREMLEFLSLKEFSTEAFDLTKETIAAVNVAKLEYELKLHPVFRIINEIPLIQANRTHLQRVLHNLLHNCTEAMREAGVLTPSIIVTMRSIKDENVVQMTIQDNGPGFKKENIQHLFEPFFTTKTRGIGLGLAISRSLIEANGGQLWVDLQEGSGAIFHLTLPIAT